MDLKPLRTYVGGDEGEHVMMRGGSVFIKSNAGLPGRPAMGTQQVLRGVGIPIHRHFEMDETFYVLGGRGTFILDDVRYPIAKGGSIFIQRNCWHGFENPDEELLLLWIMAPPGVEGMFRDLGTSPGAVAEQRTKEEVNRVAGKYGTEFR
jgi:mannose-6-phosphate isomerase-like protein (cupin superfamily)